MNHSQGASKQTCSLLVVTCGKISEEKPNEDTLDEKLKYPFPELVSLGRLEVRICYYHSLLNFKYGMCCVYFNYQYLLVFSSLSEFLVSV